MSRIRLPSEKLEVTWEDFANWILQLPDDIKNKQIWYIDIGTPYKGRPVDFDHSPSGQFVGLEEIFTTEEDPKDSGEIK